VRSGFSGSREVIWQPGPNNLLATNRHAVITIEDTCTPVPLCVRSWRGYQGVTAGRSQLARHI
jgi:hypothetical protein